MFNRDNNQYSLTIAFFMLILFMFSSCSSHKTYTRTKRNNKTYTSKRKKPKTRDTKSINSNTRLRNDLIGTAKKYMGTKYVYGGKKPGGFDCSGFITWVMNKNGVKINGSSSMIAKKGRKRNINSLRSGDLVFFGKGSKVTHIAMVVDNTRGLKVIHSTSSRGVVIDDISNSKYWKNKYLFGKSVI